MRFTRFSRRVRVKDPSIIDARGIVARGVLDSRRRKVALLNFQAISTQLTAGDCGRFSEAAWGAP
jgi:hypothetical protein